LSVLRTDGNLFTATSSALPCRANSLEPHPPFSDRSLIRGFGHPIHMLECFSKHRRCKTCI
jgi:hypothetical protein